MNVRLTVETHDSAIVYLAYGGRIDISGGVEVATVYSTPTFETGDERYQWMNKIQAVAKGVITNGVLNTNCAESVPTVRASPTGSHYPGSATVPV